jgi:hypothetical protein
MKKMAPNQPSNTTVVPDYYPWQDVECDEDYEIDEEYIYDDEEDEEEQGDIKW